MNRINIAIDGYAGCGKSTLARDLATALGYTYIDTGAMFRALTLFFDEKGVQANDPQGLEAALQERPDIAFDPMNNHLLLNGRDIEQQIRGNKQIVDRVSDYAAQASVRDYLKTIQRKFIESKGAVMEGRDIGSVIIPDAELKLFVTASLDKRVERRLNQLSEKGEMATELDVKRNLQARDKKDATRDLAPLTKATDAIGFDNSDVDRNEQLKLVLGLARPIIFPKKFFPFMQ